MLYSCTYIATVGVKGLMLRISKCMMMTSTIVYIYTAVLVMIVGQCLPGSFSSTGLESCDTCPRGYYQPYYAETSCIPCPSGMTTWRRGTRQLDQCRGLLCYEIRECNDRSSVPVQRSQYSERILNAYGQKLEKKLVEASLLCFLLHALSAFFLPLLLLTFLSL